MVGPHSLLAHPPEMVNMANIPQLPELNPRFVRDMESWSNHPACEPTPVEDVWLDKGGHQRIVWIWYRHKQFYLEDYPKRAWPSDTIWSWR